MPVDYSIRALILDDLAGADRLRRLAGWNQRQADWQRFIRLSPGGCFAAEKDETILGTVTTIEYGDEVAWVGMLLVDPEARGRGIGKALLTRAIEHLKNRKIRCIKLDATPLGEPLYRKLGFLPEWTVNRFKGKPVSHPDPCARCKQDESRLQRIIALDTEAFGVPRPDLIRHLVSSAKNVFEHFTENRRDGFAILRDGAEAQYLGPIVARHEDAFFEIIKKAVRDITREWYWDIPSENRMVTAAALKFGLSRERSLLRMHLGENRRPGDPSIYCGIADPSLG